MENDIKFIKTILPVHYEIKKNNFKNSIECVSEIGIRKGIDAEDDEHWGYVFMAIKMYFDNRFSEVNHNVCFCHTDFTIYLKK